ncbi:hypothetical protein BRC63_00025 [Halobacteriales archaeon QH_10_70_21]|nr:MAG: hypothetical protein BRC63_00025 [Halobacteriales archaeon QH_10_70_21]
MRDTRLRGAFARRGRTPTRDATEPRGTVEDGDDGVRLLVDGGAAAGAERFGTVRLRERDRDGVLRAYRGDDTLVGRVEHLSKLDEQ